MIICDIVGFTASVDNARPQTDFPLLSPITLHKALHMALVEFQLKATHWLK